MAAVIGTEVLSIAVPVTHLEVSGPRPAKPGQPHAAPLAFPHNSTVRGRRRKKPAG